MQRFSSIDLSALPVPKVIEEISYEIILSQIVADFVARYPTYDMAKLESDPVKKILEVTAYRVMLERARVNSAAAAVMLAYAQESDLDNLGALYGVARLVAIPANATSTPPVPAVYEGDGPYRERIQLSIEAYSSAGPYGAYTFYAKSASVDVLDVNVVGPESGLVVPGEVGIYVLSSLGDGTPDTALLNAVYNATNDPERRPLTDKVLVRPAVIVPYEIELTVVAKRGPDPTLVVNTAKAAIQAYALRRRKVGLAVHKAGIDGSAFLPSITSNGVVFQNPIEDVIITKPAADVDPGPSGSTYVNPASILVTYQLEP